VQPVFFKKLAAAEVFLREHFEHRISNPFLVSRVIQPEKATDAIELVEIEAVFSKARAAASSM
jgi:hypothetical protein